MAMTSENDSSPTSANPSPVESDLRMAGDIAAGSINAWHEFIKRYSGLVYSVVRRHLLTDDDDEIRSAYVDILKALYEGELAKYRGEARLSTWLIVFTRSRTIDLLRQRRGRVRKPRGYDRLGELDRKVLQLFYVERLSLDIVVQSLGWKGISPKVDDIVESIMRIERTMDPRYLERLDDEAHSRKHGAGSARMLRYLLRQKLEFEERSAGTGADHSLLDAELVETASRLREALSTLSPQEQKVLALRFGSGWPAGEIAESLHFKSQRQVYGVIDKVIRMLRRALFEEKR